MEAGTRVRLKKWHVVVALVVVVYVTSAMIAPGTVPRLVILPQPAAYNSDVKLCPLNDPDVHWERDGVFWAKEQKLSNLTCRIASTS